MKNTDWIFVAFALALLVSAAAMLLAEVQTKRQAAQSSIEAVKVAMTPFERDRARAVDKAKQAGIDPRWVEGEK